MSQSQTADTPGETELSMTNPIVPDHIRAAIHAGHVGQITIYCDGCGVEYTADYIGETRETRFAAARRSLAGKGWHHSTIFGYDGCPNCPPCDRCHEFAAVEKPCCESHSQPMCHGCYRRTHFVEVCSGCCVKCEAEGLPALLGGAKPGGGQS